jgi:hypothetical protein
LFPPTEPQPDPVPDLNVEITKALAALRAERSPAEQVSQKETNGESHEFASAFSKGSLAKNQLGAREVDAVQMFIHREPPTDRPPDRPDRGRSVSGGCSQEMVSTRYPVHQLASSLFLAHSLSGRSTPFAATAIYGVWKPSDCQASSHVGSSHEVNRVLSWMHPRCGRFMAKRDTCVAFCHPSSNLGRNLFLCGGFLPHPIQRRSKAQCDRVTCHKGDWLALPRYKAFGPLSGEAKHPAGA